MEPIRSAEALAQLLDEFAWFHDASCLSLSPPPGGVDTPERVELVLRDMGVGGYNAGDLRTYRMLRLTAVGVREWSFSGPTFDHHTEYLMQEAEPAEATAGFGFTLDVPTEVRLVADAFEYERLPDITEPLPAWTSDNHLFLDAPTAERPSPGQWVEALARAGVDVSWRIYGGPACPIERVPADYTGWFLERTSRLPDHDGGLFVFGAGVHQDRFHMTVENKGTDGELWQSACRLLARWFPDGEFHSGNCRFTAEEFLALTVAP